MIIFERSFTVKADLAAVHAFHQDSRALRLLTPPPIWVQFHHVEPLGEGSTADFTMWFGPLPFRWKAVHSMFEARKGFKDVQSSGPMKVWQHSHIFDQESEGISRVTDRVVYEHFEGIRGWVTRVLFAPPLLGFLFWYRKWVTCRYLESKSL